MYIYVYIYTQLPVAILGKREELHSAPGTSRKPQTAFCISLFMFDCRSSRAEEGESNFNASIATKLYMYLYVGINVF